MNETLFQMRKDIEIVFISEDLKSSLKNGTQKNSEKRFKYRLFWWGDRKKKEISIT